MNAPARLLLAGLFALPLLAGCDQLGIETPAQTQARQDAEGKAIGSACRQSGRALEDCYDRAQKDKKNRAFSKASIFAGWKEMDAYMRENNLAVVPPAPAESEATPTAAAEITPPATEQKTSEKTVENKTPAAETQKAEPAGDKKPKNSGKVSARLGTPGYA
ncbi:MAG: hypothetical protein EKK46_02430 [Rhodocyclaceae bacterium]|nr:MAG: hypothetical protein EKK46_02430 [Rhodocyclaceae bacterium]